MSSIVSPVPSPSRRSVWIATDVPFWKASNGSHQRIRQLAESLRGAGFTLALWHLGESLPAVQKQLLASGIWQEVLGPALAPQGILQRTRWHVQGAQHALRSKWSRHDETSDNQDGARRLAAFNDPNIARRWVSDVLRLRPDAVIFEYLSMSFLAEATRTAIPNPPLLLLDAHDVMSERSRRFRAAGLRNWLEVEVAEEAAALEQFDVVMAIQQQEATRFAQMAPRRQVIVCGYAAPSLGNSWAHEAPSTEVQPRSRQRTDVSAPISVGFLSGMGQGSEQGLARFLSICWDEIVAKVPGGIELRVGGSICESSLLRDALPPSINVLGRVDDLSRWYQGLDLSINPIEVGSGLKIKSIESMAYGCPLVTTCVGLEGMASAAGEGAIAVETIDHMAAPIARLAVDEKARAEMSQAANRYIRCHHSVEQVYGELIRVLSSDFASI